MRFRLNPPCPGALRTPPGNVHDGRYPADESLFMPQGFDRIEAGRAAGRKIAKYDTDQT